MLIFEQYPSGSNTSCGDWALGFKPTSLPPPNYLSKKKLIKLISHNCVNEVKICCLTIKKLSQTLINKKIKKLYVCFWSYHLRDKL